MGFETIEQLLAVPRRPEELGIPVSLVHDLVLRQSLYDGRTSTIRLAEKLRLSPMLLTGVVEELRELRLIEIQGLEGRDYRLALTEAGRLQANDRMQLCRYAGAAPVSLETYSTVVRAQHAQPGARLRGPPVGVLGPGHQRRPPVGAGAGGHRRRRHVPLRAPGHRQELHRRAPAARLRRQGARALRGRGRRPDHHRLRSRHPPPHSRAARRPRPALGALRPAVHHRGRRARGLDARPAVPGGQRHLPGAPCRCRPTTASSSSTTSAARR